MTPIKPVSVSLDNYRQDRPLYLKVGVGVPFQSVVDAYFFRLRRTSTASGAYWSTITAVGATARTTTGSRLRPGRRSTGSGRTASVVSAVSGSAANWGTITIRSAATGTIRPGRWKTFTGRNIDASASALRQNFSTVHGKIYFGHAFEDLSYFNIRFGAEGALFSGSFRHEGRPM